MVPTAVPPVLLLGTALTAAPHQASRQVFKGLILCLKKCILHHFVAYIFKYATAYLNLNI